MYTFYPGIDLHLKRTYLVMMNQADEIIDEQRLENAGEGSYLKEMVQYRSWSFSPSGLAELSADSLCRAERGANLRWFTRHRNWLVEQRNQAKTDTGLYWPATIWPHRWAKCLDYHQLLTIVSVVL